MGLANLHQSLSLSIAIVTYRTDPAVLERAVSSVCDAMAAASQRFPGLKTSIYVVDNHFDRSGLNQVQQLLSERPQAIFDKVRLISPETNVGYGRAHNLALFEVDSDFHLVLNPDVIMAEDAIVKALEYLLGDTGVALISPYAVNDQGHRQYLCKRYPRIFDLLLRGFAPRRMLSWFAPRLQRYEMRDMTEAATPTKGVELVSGCCMMMRTATLKQVGGFSDCYFLYFEDFDLSLRLGKVADVAYFPDMRIIHYGGNTARKGLWHILLFLSSGVKFFRTHGWRWV